MRRLRSPRRLMREATVGSRSAINLRHPPAGTAGRHAGLGATHLDPGPAAAVRQELRPGGFAEMRPRGAQLAFLGLEQLPLLIDLLAAAEGVVDPVEVTQAG